MNHIDNQKEYENFREELVKIANLHLDIGHEKEVAFRLGCLFQTASENAKIYKKINERTEK